MRRIKHWTPRYIYHRLGLSFYQWRCPDSPWLVYKMVDILDQWLKPTDRGIEWGSGRSTTWFAARVGSLVSVEHDPAWYERVKTELARRELRNVEYHLRQDEADYIRVANKLSPESFDFCLVDGVARDDCALAAVSLVKPGGIVIVDNYNCYLPTNSRSPYSRRPEQGCYTQKWSTYLEQVREWRRIWTSDGVCDTGLWMKPINMKEANAGKEISYKFPISLRGRVS